MFGIGMPELLIILDIIRRYATFSEHGFQVSGFGCQPALARRT